MGEQVYSDYDTSTVEEGRNMVTKLSAIGTDLGLIIEKSLLRRLAIDADTALEVHMDGDSLVIRRASRDGRDRLIETADRLMDLHDETFRKLAQ